MRTRAMRHSAWLAWRSRPRFSRWRWVRPEDTEMGATPHSCARAASPRSRYGLEAVLNLRPAAVMSGRHRSHDPTKWFRLLPVSSSGAILVPTPSSSLPTGCREPFGLLPTRRESPRTRLSSGRFGSHCRQVRAASFSSAVPPACHKQPSRAVSSGESRSISLATPCRSHGGLRPHHLACCTVTRPG
jgi:hypothetical protein